MGKLTAGKDYVKWEKPGQKITGTLLKVELSRGDNAGKMLHMVDADGKPFIVSAPTLLAEAVEENFSTLHEKEITITYTSQDKPAKGRKEGLRRFDIEWPDDDE